MINFHSQLQTHLAQDFFDLIQRLVAEIFGPEHFMLTLLHQFTDVLDVRVL